MAKLFCGWSPLWLQISQNPFSNKNPNNSTATVGGWGVSSIQSSSSSFCSRDLNAVAGLFFNSSCSPSRDSNPSYLPMIIIFSFRHHPRKTQKFCYWSYSAIALIKGAGKHWFSVFMCVVSKVCVCFQRHTNFLQRIINNCPISSFAAEKSKSECAGFHLTSVSTSSWKIWQMGVCILTTTYQVCLPHVLLAAKVFEESMNEWFVEWFACPICCRYCSWRVDVVFANMLLSCKFWTNGRGNCSCKKS